MVLSIILRGTNWRKMPDFTEIVYQKAAITAVLSLFVWGLWVFRDRINVASQQQPMVIWLAFIALRILPFIVVYLLLGYDARSDVHMFYVSALDAYKLKLVYKDFDSAYSPVFAYLTALPLIFWNSPKAIILLLILIEGITLQLTFRLYQSGNGVHFPGDSPFHKALIYLFLPIPFVLSVLSGQEDLLMWLFGVICLLVWRERKDDLWIGIVLGIGMVVTKAILILTLIPVFFLVRNQIRYVLGLLIVGIPSLAIMYWLVGLEFLEPIQQANDPRTPNIWTILRTAIGPMVPLGAKILNWVGLVLTLGFAGFLGFYYRQRNRFADGFVALWIVTYAFMMIVQQSSLANYAYIFILPMLFATLSFDKKYHLLVLLLFNFTVVVQPPIWWGLNMPLFKSFADLSNPWALAEYLLEIAIVGCLIWVIVTQIRSFRAVLTK